MAFRTSMALAAAWTFLVGGARAESLVEDNVESRFMLAFQADAAALQKRLPPELEVSPAPAGPAKDANLIVVFYDRLLQQDGTGKTTPAATQRMAVVVAAVKSRASGKPAYAVLRVFSPNPAQVPGFYKNGVLAEVERELSFEAKALEPGIMRDEWNVKTRAGDSIRLRLEYVRGAPVRAQRELQIFSAAQGDLYRIYRTDELTDVVRSAPASVDRAKKLEYSVAIHDMGDLFGRETRLVAALANPAFLRKVFLPEQHAQR